MRHFLWINLQAMVYVQLKVLDCVRLLIFAVLAEGQKVCSTAHLHSDFTHVSKLYIGSELVTGILFDRLLQFDII